jgi:peptide/histidine transporter 3/4
MVEERSRAGGAAVAVDGESLRRPEEEGGRRKKGGWITFPFMAVSLLAFGLSSAGAMGNLVVYLVKEYHVPSVDAAQISTIVSGCISVAPVAGAIVADAFFGCFPVVAVAMVFSVLALVVFTLTASVRGLRPAACVPGATACEAATAGQMAVLYAGVFLLCVSSAGARFNQATMGADQFDAAADRDVFFNWYFIFFYGSAVLGSTVLVYVQDAVSWELGFGLAATIAAAGLAALLLGARYYRRPAARGSPFTGIARVVVAAARKRKIDVAAAAAASGDLKFYYGPRSGDGDDDGGKPSDDNNFAPSDSFR